MDINFALALDEQTAQKVMGSHSVNTTRNQTFVSNSHDKSDCNCKCATYNGSKARCKKMKASQLRYNTEESIEKMTFVLTESEEKLHRILQIEHNTIDIINENLKLKEALKFVKSCYASDINSNKNKEKEIEKEIEDLKEKLKAAAKENELKSAENGDLQASLQKRQKDYDELYALLNEREKEIETANRFSEQLMAEKKKFIAFIEQKDRKVEALNKDLYNKEQKLQSSLEDSNKYIKDLQLEKAQLLEALNKQNERIGDLSRHNAELTAEVKRLQNELRDALNRPGEDEETKEALNMRMREIEGLKNDIANIKNAHAKEKEQVNKLRDQIEDDQKHINELKRQLEAVNRELMDKINKLNDEKQANGELTSKAEQLSDDNGNLRDEIEALKKKIQKLMAEIEDGVNARQESDKQSGNFKDMLDRARDDLDAKDRELADLRRELEKLKGERDSLQQKHRNAENEVASKNAELEKQKADRSRLTAEIEDLKAKLAKASGDQAGLNAELEKANVLNKQKIKDLEDDLEAKDKKLKDYLAQIKALTDKYNEVVDDYNQLKDSNQDLVDQYNKAQQENVDILNERNKLSHDIDNYHQQLEDAHEDNKKKDKTIADLMKELQALKESAGNKKEFEDFKLNFFGKLKDLLKKIALVKSKYNEILDFLVEGESADYTGDEAKINKLAPDQYFTAGLQLLKDMEAVSEELNEECQVLKDTIHNLQREKQDLLIKTQELEEKYSDLRIRHDVKTDMVGKLSVKVFILMTEIERLNKEIPGSA